MRSSSNEVGHAVERRSLMRCCATEPLPARAHATGSEGRLAMGTTSVVPRDDLPRAASVRNAMLAQTRLGR